MLISYGEARSSVSASANLQPSGGSRRLGWLNAIVGPSPGWVDRHKEAGSCAAACRTMMRAAHRSWHARGRYAPNECHKLGGKDPTPELRHLKGECERVLHSSYLKGTNDN